MEEPRAKSDDSICVSLAALERRITEHASYMELLRKAGDKFGEERDRRYSEVKQELEKALKIKEQADRDALELDRQIRSYKDEKANELREQLSHERGNYASKGDLQAATEKIEETLKPMLNYINNQQGRVSGVGSTLNTTHIIIALIISVTGLYLASTKSTQSNTTTAPQVIYVPAPAQTSAPSSPQQR